MDSDGELRLTIMAPLAQEESRKKNNSHTIQRDCVTVFISVVLPTLLSGKRTDALCFACSPCR